MSNYIDLIEYPFDLLKDVEIASIDTETLGKTRATNIPIYYSFATPTFKGAGPTTTRQGYDFLMELCKLPCPKVFHNASFDLTVLEKADAVVKGEIHDTVLMHMLLDEHHLEAHRLKALSRELLGRPRLDELELRRAQVGIKFNDEVPQEIQHPYAEADAVDTLDLFFLLRPQLIEQGLWELYRDEVAVELVYKEIDENGIAINLDAIKETIDGLQIPLAKLAEEIYQAFDERFLISSRAQLGEVLAKHFRLTVRTASGQIKTTQEILGKYISDPRMQLVAAYNFLNKARSTIEGYRKRETGGRLYPNYRQTTKSGRCACADPNLTTIPKQRGRITEVEVGNKELALICANAFRQVRKVFIAPPGALLASFDYEQIEYRCFAYYSESERLLKRLREGEDFHDLICEMVFGENTPRLRHMIKVVNYGLLYGMGNPLLFRMLRIEGVENPLEVLRRYEATIPEMRSTQRRAIAIGRRRGYVHDIFGRRYRFVPEAPHAIVAWICQGTTANIKKESLRRIGGDGRLLEGKRTKLVADIHDELLLELYPEDLHLVNETKLLMEDFPQFGIPFPVSVSLGQNFLEMKDVEKPEKLKEMDFKELQNVGTIDKTSATGLTAGKGLLLPNQDPTSNLGQSEGESTTQRVCSTGVAIT